MDERTTITVSAAAFAAVFLIVFYVIRGVLLRQRMGEFVDRHFNDGLPFDQLSGLARDVSSRRFMGSPD
jgi:hypothetical protein